MSANGVTESIVKQAALVWLGALGYRVLSGQEITSVETNMTKITGENI